MRGGERSKLMSGGERSKLISGGERSKLMSGTLLRCKPYVDVMMFMGIKYKLQRRL